MPGLRGIPEISPSDLQILRSICRVSARHALEAISSMSGLHFDVDQTEAGLMPLDTIPARLGGDEQTVAAVSMALSGAWEGMLLVAIEPSPVRHLLSRLVSDETIDLGQLTSLQMSALSETGNMLAGAFCKGLAGTSDRPLLLTIPEIAVDMAASVLQAPLVEVTQGGDEALVLDCTLRTRATERPIVVRILLIPGPGAVEVLLEAGRGTKAHGATGSIGT